MQNGWYKVAVIVLLSYGFVVVVRTCLTLSFGHFLQEVDVSVNSVRQKQKSVELVQFDHSVLIVNRLKTSHHGRESVVLVRNYRSTVKVTSIHGKVMLEMQALSTDRISKT